jgi:hypothetical protein
MITFSIGLRQSAGMPNQLYPHMLFNSYHAEHVYIQMSKTLPQVKNTHIFLYGLH